MSKDLKDLIEKAEEEQASIAFLEKTIEKLKLENATLKKKLYELNPEIKLEPVQQVEEHAEASKEISILRNIVSSLKQELIKTERDKTALETQLDELKIEFNKLREEMFDSAKDELIIKTQNSLNTLINDYGKLENENKSLKMKLSKLEEDLESNIQVTSNIESEKFNKQQLEKELGNLKYKIHELESKNQSLNREITNLKTQGDLNSAEQMIERLKGKNFELEQENKNLKREKLKNQKYELQIDELKTKIEILEDKNKELKDKDSILLAKTITAMSARDRKTQISESNLKTPEIDKIAQFSMLKEEVGVIQATEFIKEQKSEIETFNESIEIEKVPEENEDGSIARKWQCPHCGNTNKAQIREQDDKTHVIYTYPMIYGKKYTCGQCGKEWR
ncbi:MAG: hypothetical protein EU533_05475 [Promethearchaeota archaeon]|nr:MAG: hypothetical protein EU533_05475 [Candidatus Lokiarchaeota archaeon]